MFASQVVWDAGATTETVIPGGFLGGYMFSVPDGASLGAHNVALSNSNGLSNVMTFTVTAPEPWTSPRVDRVSLISADFSGGNVEPLLYVQGANIDVGATVQIDGSDVASISHQGLRNELYGTDTSVLGYPIYHYLSVLAVPGAKPTGSTIQVRVRNLDGGLSSAFSYTLPSNAASMDSDGDSLLDEWEKNGYDADSDGSVDIDLAAVGAHYLRPDILVEVDTMNGLANPPIPAAGGTPGVFALAQQMFAQAPVMNPLGQEGMNLILDTSGTVPHTPVLHFGTIIPSNGTSTDFATIRNANFTANRDDIYQYAIWGDELVGGYSGVSDVDFGGSEVGDDFLISFDNFSAGHQTLRAQVATFVHELGHNLGQRHGGVTHDRYNPNYWSAMTYAWQLRSGRSDAVRRQRVTCAPIYWHDATATEPNGAAPASWNATADYSHGMGPQVVENNNSLQEATGVCGHPVDWNNDGDTTDVNLSTDANDESGSAQTINDVSNWSGLRFNGPADDGQL
jgi:hypothetical protein